MEWTKDKEQELLRLRERGFTYKQIADQFGTTPSAVKHKARRLMQNDNDDRYKHTEEKAAMLYSLMKSIDKRPMKILETHCGYGGMTGHYMEFGSVESYDIDKKRVEHIKKYFWQGEITFHADSEQELYRLVYEKKI